MTHNKEKEKYIHSQPLETVKKKTTVNIKSGNP